METSLPFDAGTGTGCGALKPQSAPTAKAAAAWCVEAERLAMGDESRLTQAIRRVKANRDRELIRCQRQLEQLLNAGEGRTNEK
jgi:hypothetical protein